jgi:rhodanese-related sulfurtransferase
MRRITALFIAALFAAPLIAGEIAWIDQDTLLARLAEKDAGLVVLDVRTPEEFAAGHVPGALNVAHDQVEARLPELADYKSKDVVVYCRSGRRSNLALEVLKANGFERLWHLEGDILAWQAQNRPVETSEPLKPDAEPARDPQ